MPVRTDPRIVRDPPAVPPELREMAILSLLPLPRTIKAEHVLPRSIGAEHIMMRSIGAEHIMVGVITPVAAIPILTQTESTTSSTLTTTAQRTIWRGSLLNMDRVRRVEVEVDWASAGRGDIDLYNVTDAVKIADLAAPSAATSRSTAYYDVTSAMKALTSDKVIALQIAGDGTNAITVYKAQLLIYMSLG